MMKLAELAAAMGGVISDDDRETVFNRAVIDSRQAGTGSLFFALAGKTRDGHEFVTDVLESGGCAVVSRGSFSSGVITVGSVEKALLLGGVWKRNQLDCPVVGITGSSGKTTTRELITAALSGSFQAGGTIGNLNNHLGLPLTLLNLPEGLDIAVLEMGMNHPGELELLGSIARPDTAVITNIGLAHMQYFESREGVAGAKAELLSETVQGGLAVIPANEPILEKAALNRGLDIVRVGSGGDVWLRKNGKGFTVEPSGDDVRLLLRGEHNYRNSLFALVVAESFGVPRRQALDRMARYCGMAGRGRVVFTAGIHIMDESYNANPDSTVACLRVLGETESGRIAVLGDMLELGGISPQMHRNVLEFADKLGLRLLILTGTLYAGEAACLSKTDFAIAQDWKKSLRILRGNMKTGDTVLVKGSHSLEMNRIIESLQEEN